MQMQQLAEQAAKQLTQEELAQGLEENRQKTAQQIRQLQAKVQTARDSYQQQKKGWKLGSKFISFFS